MVLLDKAVVARYKSHGKNFEILVDPDKALSFKKGGVDISDVLAVEDVFESASRGERCSEDSLMKAFGTTDVGEVAKKILLSGEIQLTHEQRRRIQEEKRRKVVAFIAKHAINPKTRLPHPPQRIELAMEEAKVRVDPFKSVDENVKEVMKGIKAILPIRFEEIEIAVKIPPKWAPKSYGDVSSHGEIIKDEWQPDGSWICVVRIPAGQQSDFYAMLNRITRGEVETKVLK
jgi:ribosome maturation protein SDO1